VINNWLILLLIALAAVAAGLAHLAARARWSFGLAAVILGLVSVILVCINWAEST
jgi:hypothetical protein